MHVLEEFVDVTPHVEFYTPITNLAHLLLFLCGSRRGTLVSHPVQENKTQGIDNELTARDSELATRLKSKAEQSKRWQCGLVM